MDIMTFYPKLFYNESRKPKDIFLCNYDTISTTHEMNRVA